MTLAEIASLRLSNQQLSRKEFVDPAELVSHFGAMQAQDYAMAKLSIGTRLNQIYDSAIEASFSRGEIIRTHILRPTWHFVAASDIHWMLELTAKNVLRQLNSFDKSLGLDDKTFARSNELIIKSLEGGKHKTRNEIAEVLNRYGIATTGQRGAHLMFFAELSAIVCSGDKKGKEHTYALLNERVKKRIVYEKEEALKEIASRYFRSHGPATLKDFIWWSGLSVADAKLGIVLNEKDFESFEYGSTTFWMGVGQQFAPLKRVHFLPAFDEYLIAYKDRSAGIDAEFSQFAFTKNGIFSPVIIVDGKVAGIWKRTFVKEKVTVQMTLFKKIPKILDKEIDAEITRLGNFFEMKTELIK